MVVSESRSLRYPSRKRIVGRHSNILLRIAHLLDLYATVGCHPTRSADFDKFNGGPDAYLKQLDKTIANHLKGPGRVVAVGECALGEDAVNNSYLLAKDKYTTDYDRLHFANKETQKRHFSACMFCGKTLTG